MGVHYPQPKAPQPYDCGHGGDHASGGETSLLGTLSSHNLLGLGGAADAGPGDTCMSYDPHVSISLSVPDVASMLPLSLDTSGDHGLLGLGSLDLPLLDHCDCHGLLHI